MYACPWSRSWSPRAGWGLLCMERPEAEWETGTGHSASAPQLRLQSCRMFGRGRIVVLALGLWAPVRGARMSGARLPRTPVSHIPKCGAAPGCGPPARRVPVLSGFSDTKVSPRRPRAFVSKSLNLHLPRILPACCPHHRILTGAPANHLGIHLGFPPAAPAPGAASALLCASVTARAGVAQ